MSETKTEDFEVAHRLAAGEKMLGWSSSHNPQGLVLPFFPGLLSRRATDALLPNLAQLWERGLRSSIGFWVFGGEREALVFERLERVYTEQFARVPLSNDSQEKILSWCLDVAQQRVNAEVTTRLDPTLPIEGKKVEDELAAVFFWRGEPEVRLHCGPDGRLFLTGVQLSSNPSHICKR
jgi:hypothetical protein